MYARTSEGGLTGTLPSIESVRVVTLRFQTYALT
jgi:hypothetical protein